MKFLFNWLYTKLLESREINTDSIGHQPSSRLVSSHQLESTGLELVIYRASGGHIVECRIYDRKTDRNDNKLHIITDDKDLGEELGRIITYENLRS